MWLARFRGMLAIASAAFCLDWLSKAAAQAWLDPAALVYNPEPAKLWLPVVLCAICALVAYLIPARLAVIGCGLALGGGSANMLDRALRGPVLDFIPEPDLFGRSDYYANLADVMIVCSWVALVPVMVSLAMQMLR
jgi:hypothetical protein